MRIYHALVSSGCLAHASVTCGRCRPVLRQNLISNIGQLGVLLNIVVLSVSSLEFQLRVRLTKGCFYSNLATVHTFVPSYGSWIIAGLSSGLGVIKRLWRFRFDLFSRIVNYSLIHRHFYFLEFEWRNSQYFGLGVIVRCYNRCILWPLLSDCKMFCLYHTNLRSCSHRFLICLIEHPILFIGVSTSLMLLMLRKANLSKIVYRISLSRLGRHRSFRTSG
jgi:hypothetical protein